MSQRVCFVLHVLPEHIDEYRQWHRAVWPQMRQALHETGWHNYSLFMHEDGTLIGYLETDDFARALREMSLREVNTQWQNAVANFFGTGDGLPDERIRSLEEIFHLD